MKKSVLEIMTTCMIILFLLTLLSSIDPAGSRPPDPPISDDEPCDEPDPDCDIHPDIWESPEETEPCPIPGCWYYYYDPPCNCYTYKEECPEDDCGVGVGPWVEGGYPWRIYYFPGDTNVFQASTHLEEDPWLDCYNDGNLKNCAAGYYCVTDASVETPEITCGGENKSATVTLNRTYGNDLMENPHNETCWNTQIEYRHANSGKSVSWTCSDNEHYGKVQFLVEIDPNSPPGPAIISAEGRSCSGKECDDGEDEEFEIEVMGVDLDIDGLSDSNEDQPPGRYIQIGQEVDMDLCLYPTPADPECAFYEADPRWNIQYPSQKVAIYEKHTNLYIAPGNWYYLKDWAPKQLIILGLTESEFPGDVEVISRFKTDPIDIVSGGEMTDTVVVTVIPTDIDVDLDVDSDNDNGINMPEEDVEEEELEDCIGHPGKYIAINRDNDDDEWLGGPYYHTDAIHERIDDYADGYNRDKSSDLFNDDLNLNENDFIPLILKIPELVNLNQATLKFNYEGSDPMQLYWNDESPNDPPNRRKVDPSNGFFRIWTYKGDIPRNGTSIVDGGDYIKPNQVIIADLLDFSTESGVYKTVLWVEGISSQWGFSKEITVELDPDGPQGPLSICSDKVQMTGVDCFIEAASEFNGFDHTLNPRGLMVPIRSNSPNTNNIKVKINNADIRFRSLDLSIATVPEDVYGSGDHILTITGNQPGPTIIEAYCDTDDELVISQLRVYVLPEKTIEVTFHNCNDTFGHESTLKPQDADEILTVMNNIWEKQTNIKLIKAQNWFENIEITTDYGESINGTEAENIYYEFQHSDVEFDIFLMWDVEDVTAFCLWNLGACFGDLNMDDNSNDARGEVYAHELGHYNSYCGNEIPDKHFNHSYEGNVGDPNGDWNLTGNLMTRWMNHARHLTIRQAVIVNLARLY